MLLKCKALQSFFVIPAKAEIYIQKLKRGLACAESLISASAACRQTGVRNDRTEEKL